ncbi:major capsid protein P2 [Vibrio panuliri]|uniref:Viral coat protein P2 N-terminal domain-containing protein n=1 Tax=Vibrio panuliri TaxID=1381081 RepID=A0ABX3FF77_9VIBR|nr:major capsid protein P2 [Vibrio panuliri]KAB1457400.1 hypothetical protein F7O85_06565 [Vibrio panuliri]OLQ91439.1 hypothetical protein BIY20_01115 [Vibrio panuliri]
MAVTAAQQAAYISVVKGPFNVRPIELDPFRSGSPFSKHAILDIKDLYAFASLEVQTDLPIERLGRVSFERNGKEFIGIDAIWFHKNDTKKNLPVMAKGVANATKTRLVIPFADETLRTLAGIRRGELVHLEGELLTLKVAVKSKEEGDPDFPEFSAKARVVDYQPERFFQQRYTQTSITQTQTGEQAHEFPLVGANVRLRSMLLETQNDDITHIAIRRDNEIIWESSVEDLKFEMARFGDMKAPAKGVWLPFVETGFANEQAFIPVARNSLKLLITKRTPGEIDVYNDFIEIEQLPQL